MHYRVNMLATVYRVEKDPRMLARLNEEIIAACNFPTWNPKHFLDVGEMSLAIALAIDWAGGGCLSPPCNSPKSLWWRKESSPAGPKAGITRAGPTAPITGTRYATGA